MTDINKVLEEHGVRANKLTVNTFLADEDEKRRDDSRSPEEYVLIEGDSESLYFLGQILLAMANGELGDSFFLHPNGPGNTHFSGSSQTGIYLHMTS